MSAPNLTRVAAQERAATIDVQNYRIDLDLTTNEKTFRSHTVVTFTAKPGATTFVDLVAPTLISANLNGTDLDVAGYDESAGLTLPNLAEQNVLSIVADCEYSNTGEGLHRFVDPADGSVYLYSQFETADAKRMFACFDQPDLKATYSLRVSAPAGWQVISNGATEPVETTGDTSVHTFATTEVMSTYLVALIAGPYAQWTDEYRDEHGVIPLRLFCRASLAEFMDAERLFTETKQGFGFYHRNFGTPYPFGKYDQLFVPEFNAGAMENAGAVTFLEDYVFRSRVTNYLYERRCETVLHEMAHMWFGDLVTMTWWDDLWLNESFATFASVLAQVDATEYTDAWTTFANVEKSWAYRQDQLPSTHPIAADMVDLQAVEVNFDGITYAKGASVLKQLVAYVGLDPFLAGLRDYFAAHRFGNATFGDLLGALERSSGRDLQDWGGQWLKTTGVNVLRPEFETDENGVITSFAIVQDGATPGAGETRVHRVRVGVYDEADCGCGKLLRKVSEELDISGARTEVPALVGVPRGKLILLNDDDLTYATIRLDPESLDTAMSRIGDIAEPMPRTLVWSAVWEMTRQGELSARDFVALVSRGIAAETQIGVVQRVLLQTATALDSYAEPGWAAATGWPSFAARLLELAQSAEAGSDHQLAFVNTLLTGVLRDDQLSAAATLLDGTDPADVGLPGLTVDAELRWKLVKALATAGAIDTDPAATPAIDAELARDNTAAGARHAEAARAARPLAAAKESAFTASFTDDALANVMVRAIVEGLVRPGQADLLAEYTDRYFAEVADLWARRSSEVAQTVVIGLYPAWDVSQAALDKADAFLAGDHPPALRRLIVEGRDSTARALRARAVDAAAG